MGALWLAACFILRTLGARNQQEMTFVIVSTLLFLLAPICKFLQDLPLGMYTSLLRL